MRIERRYTTDGQSPYADIAFRLTTSEIRNPDGSVVFHADGVEVPEQWSQVASDVLAQKYFRKAGVPGTQRELSVKQLVKRVAHTIRRAGEGLGRGLRGVVRMDADGGVHKRIAVGQPDSGFKIRRPVAGADRHHASDTGGERALDYRLAVFFKLRVVQVAVRIDQVHFRRAPTGMSSWKPASTGLPSSTDAATIIPFDSMPFSLRGCRLATITTLRSTSSVGV